MAILIPPKTPHAQVAATALGHLSETGPISEGGATVALVAQALRGTGLGLRAGELVTNIIVCVNVAAAGTAGVVNVGLYSSAYGKLASTGDVNTSFTAIGQVAIALTTPYTATVEDVFYPVVLMTTAFGTTQPSLVGSGQTGGSVALVGKPKPFWLQATQSSLPTTATPADTGAAIWFAVS